MNTSHLPNPAKPCQTLPNPAKPRPLHFLKPCQPKPRGLVGFCQLHFASFDITWKRGCRPLGISVVGEGNGQGVMAVQTPSHEATLDVISVEAAAKFLQSTPAVQARVRRKIDSLITKSCKTKEKRRRVWRLWPSQGRVDDALRIVETMRDQRFWRHGVDDQQKVMSSDICVELQPTPEKSVDRMLCLVVQSVVDKLAEVEPTLQIHSVNESLRGSRNTRGHGILLHRQHTERFLAALSTIENRLKACEEAAFVASSPSLSETSDTILE